MIILPSLEIVPAKYNVSTNTLLSQIPIDGTGDFTVTRATSPTTGQSTRVNALGKIELVADNVPRLDYPIGGGCPALLVEPSAVNLVPSGTTYTALAGALVSAVADSPAVAISGTLCTKNEASGSLRYIRQSVSTVALVSSTTYTLSRFFKYNGVAFNTTLEAEGSAQWGGVGFIQRIVLSAASGVTLGLSTACTGSVENFGNGWYRVNVRITTGATIGGSTNVTILSELPSALSTGQGFLTALPQLEVGLAATSYINTTAGSITRAADVISDTTATALIGQTEGTIYAEVDVRNFANAGIFFSISDGTSSNRVQVYKFTDSKIYADRISATQSALTSISTSALTTGIYKLAFAYKTGDSALFINGVQIGSTALQTFTMGALTQVYVGTRFDNTLFLNDRIRAAALYTTRLTDTQLALLTSPYTSYSSMASALSYTLG